MSWQKAHDANAVIIGGNGGTMVNTMKNNNWQTVYGKNEFSNGKHIWKIRIDSMTGSIAIGIASDLYKANYYYFHAKKNTYSWHSPNGQIVNETSWTSYHNRTTFTKGDIVTIHLDLNERKLSYSKNGIFIGDAVTNLKPSNYRLAVSIHTGPSQITLLNTDKIHEQKEEIKTEEKNESYIKESIKYIGKQFNALNTKYSSENMNNYSYNQLLDKLQCLNEIENDMKQLDIEYSKCKKKLVQSKEMLSEKMIANTSQYKLWKLKEIEIWLHGLDNGRYKKYISKLLQEFKKDEINGSHLPTLDKSELRSFGVNQIDDRNSLFKHFQQLEQTNEGNDTAVI